MMVGPWSAEVARRDPMLDDLLLFPFPGFTRQPNGSILAPYRTLWQQAAKVRRGSYDAALLLRFDHWWGALLAAAAGIPVRIGHAVPEVSPFLSHLVDPPGRGHWVERSLAVGRRLLELWGVSAGAAGQQMSLRFGRRIEDGRSAEALLGEIGLDGALPLVAFHPGSGSPMKLWPEDRWVELGRMLAARGARIVVTGSANERNSAERIAGAITEGHSLAGRTDLGTLASLFRRCALVVGTDNGPLHLAVAVNVPTLQLFGPTDPAVFGPWGDAARHRLISSGWSSTPCGRLDLEPPAGGYAPCMEAIPLAKVAAESVGMIWGESSLSL